MAKYVEALKFIKLYTALYGVGTCWYRNIHVAMVNP